MKTMKNEIIILCLIFIGENITNGFNLIPDNDQNNLTTVDVGKSFTMVCKANDAYEYCTFEHNGNECVFEWKRKSGEVELQTDECLKYRNRITFIGDYSQDTCAMQLDNVTLGDAGKWTCELEEYKWGSRRGDTDKQAVSLTVNMTTNTEGLLDTNVDTQLDNQENNSTQATDVSILDSCAMQLVNVTLEDAGKWTCELEEYKWCCSSGDTDKTNVSLIVNMTTNTEGSLDTNVDTQLDNQENNSTQTTEVSIFGKIVGGIKEAYKKGKAALTDCVVNCEGSD